MALTYNQIMQKAGKQLNISVYYTIEGTTTTYTQDEVLSARPFFNAKLVGTVMKGLELELTEDLPTNTAIYFKNEATYGDDTASKIYGAYYLKESVYNADTRTYSCMLYDDFLNSMVDYQPITIEYPTTVYDFFSQLVTELGYTTDIESLPNGDKVITSDIYEGINYTYRSVLEDIGQATASLFYIDGSVVKKASLGANSVTIDDDILMNENIALGQHFGAINTIVLSRSADSDSIYYPANLPDDPKEFKISDNQLMNGNDREDYMEDIYDELAGIEFDIFDLSLVGWGGFDLLQKVEIETINGSSTLTYNSYVFNNEEVFTQGYEENIYTEIPEEGVTNYKASDSTDRRINQAYVIVNKQKQEVEALTTTVSGFDADISSLKINSQSISSEVANQTTQLNDLNEQISTIRSTFQEQTNTAITTWFQSSGIEGTLDDLQAAIDSNEEDIINFKSYIKNGVIDDQSSPFYGETYVELGSATNQTIIRILPERIQFLTNGLETAYISNNSLYINESTILTRQQIGGWITEEDAVGNLNTYWA